VTTPDVVLLNGRVGDGPFVSVSIQSGLPKGFGARLEIHGTNGVLVVTGANALHASDASLHLSGATGDSPLEPMVVPDRYQTVPAAVPDTAARNVAGLYLTLADAITHDGDPRSLEPSFATAVDLHRYLDDIDASSAAGPARNAH
jgi:predicted dehydrogenase